MNNFEQTKNVLKKISSLQAEQTYHGEKHTHFMSALDLLPFRTIAVQKGEIVSHIFDNAIEVNFKHFLNTFENILSYIQNQEEKTTPFSLLKLLFSVEKTNNAFNFLKMFGLDKDYQTLIGILLKNKKTQSVANIDVKKLTSTEKKAIKDFDKKFLMKGSDNTYDLGFSSLMFAIAKDYRESLFLTFNLTIQENKYLDLTTQISVSKNVVNKVNIQQKDLKMIEYYTNAINDEALDGLAPSYLKNAKSVFIVPFRFDDKKYIETKNLLNIKEIESEDFDLAEEIAFDLKMPFFYFNQIKK